MVQDNTPSPDTLTEDGSPSSSLYGTSHRPSLPLHLTEDRSPFPSLSSSATTSRKSVACPGETTPRRRSIPSLTPQTGPRPAVPMSPSQRPVLRRHTCPTHQLPMEALEAALASGQCLSPTTPRELPELRRHDRQPPVEALDDTPLCSENAPPAPPVGPARCSLSKKAVEDSEEAQPRCGAQACPLTPARLPDQRSAQTFCPLTSARLLKQRSDRMFVEALLSSEASAFACMEDMSPGPSHGAQSQQLSVESLLSKGSPRSGTKAPPPLSKRSTSAGPEAASVRGVGDMSPGPSHGAQAWPLASMCSTDRRSTDRRSTEPPSVESLLSTLEGSPRSGTKALPSPSKQSTSAGSQGPGGAAPAGPRRVFVTGGTPRRSTRAGSLNALSPSRSTAVSLPGTARLPRIDSILRGSEEKASAGESLAKDPAAFVEQLKVVQSVRLALSQYAADARPLREGSMWPRIAEAAVLHVLAREQGVPVECLRVVHTIFKEHCRMHGADHSSEQRDGWLRRDGIAVVIERLAGGSTDEVEAAASSAFERADRQEGAGISFLALAGWVAERLRATTPAWQLDVHSLQNLLISDPDIERQRRNEEEQWLGASLGLGRTTFRRLRAHFPAL